jgi:predicted outer membrane repeat protein
VFAENHAGERGGAIYSWGNVNIVGNIDLTNCRFIANDADDNGGAIVLGNDYDVSAIDCLFDGNTCADRGGAVYCGGAEYLIFTDCEFRDNAAQSSGGAIYSNFTDPHFLECTFSENSAHRGGAFQGDFYSDPEFDTCTFAGNSAVTGGGAIGIADQGFPLLASCTLYGNTAGEGAGIWISTDSPSLATVRNTIIAFSSSGGAVHCGENGFVNLQCCDIYGNVGGDYVGCIADEFGVNGNIADNPWFCAPEEGDFSIASESPCAPFSPPNDECDLIGAWPVGCDVSAADERGGFFSELYLASGRPNPFSGTTSIRYVIPVGAEGPVVLRIYDPVGRLVRTLLHAPRPAGVHTVAWDGTSQAGAPVAGGVYFCQLMVNGEAHTKRLILVR